MRVGSVESVISVNRASEHPECKHFYFIFMYFCIIHITLINVDIKPCIQSLDADKLGQLGPSLGMKKSSSLESLQTMVQEVS